MTGDTGFEPNRDPVQVTPACCQQESQEHSFHTLDWQALPHDVSGCAEDSAQWPLLVLVKVCAGSVIILKCCNVFLHASQVDFVPGQC